MDHAAVTTGTESLRTPTQVAVEVARTVGVVAEAPVLIQETNNTVVWLRPKPVIAKVAVRRRSFADLLREHAVASALAANGAPIAPPLAGIGPLWDEQSGFPVTLWHRLENQPGQHVSGQTVGQSLRQLHEAFDRCDLDLPNLSDGLIETQMVLKGDVPIPALSPIDRGLLLSVMTDLTEALARWPFDERRLHGEPHDGNYLVTDSGLRWIDFEDASVGPREWDLAFLGEDALSVFDWVDDDLLRMLRTLNSARVATWCFVQARFPEMRRHGEMHLERVRSAPQS